MLDKHRPLPDRLSDWNDRREVLYRCCKCGASFGFYGSKQQYCHMCGNKIDWSKSVVKCSEAFKNEYDALWKKYEEHHDIKRYEDEKIALLYKLYTGEIT